MIINEIAFGGDSYSFRGFASYTFSPFVLMNINETMGGPLIFLELLRTIILVSLNR